MCFSHQIPFRLLCFSFTGDGTAVVIKFVVGTVERDVIRGVVIHGRHFVIGGIPVKKTAGRGREDM